MIPFNRPAFDGAELAYLQESITLGHTSGNGPFTKRAEALLDELHQPSRSLLTTSCTHALELSARLLNLQPGDEVIVPAYTFVTSASAFMWNGAKPVFVDVRPDTLNLDYAAVVEAITPKTRAICVVHYAGVGAEPDRFSKLAADRGIVLVEDNAHGLGGAWQGQPLGTFGSLSSLSFHETKNITCGEGGALVINDATLQERAEILREKGTDRSRFLRGQVDKYTWVDLGSSWVLSDLLAAVLTGQLERFDDIQAKRMLIWQRYDRELRDWAAQKHVRTPVIPENAQHTAHMYHLRFSSITERDAFITHMREHEILSVFHYQSLADSPMGKSLGDSGHFPNAVNASETLVRLPMFGSMTEQEQDRVIEAVRSFG
jgi:dTDP-4-amino-4,6-dideoxygalactose transaminase